MNKRGKFIVFEGGDAAGKSTQAELFAAKVNALLTREPGGTKLGERIRSLLLVPDGDVLLMPKAELFLMAAARAQHVKEVIEPALEQGRNVVCDRYSASTLAYQGFGRRLPIDEVEEVVGFASYGLEPDIYVLLDISLEVALTRKSLGGDRIEDEGQSFHERVLEGFRRLASDNPASWVVVDASRSIAETAETVNSLVLPRLGD
jgi:dTMP kinase